MSAVRRPLAGQCTRARSARTACGIRMISALLGLASALGLGVADFMGRFSARALGATLGLWRGAVGRRHERDGLASCKRAAPYLVAGRLLPSRWRTACAWRSCAFCSTWAWRAVRSRSSRPLLRRIQSSCLPSTCPWACGRASCSGWPWQASWWRISLLGAQ